MSQSAVGSRVFHHRRAERWPSLSTNVAGARATTPSPDVIRFRKRPVGRSFGNAPECRGLGFIRTMSAT